MTEHVPLSPLARVSVFLGLRRSTVGLLAMVVLVGMGERMAERFLPIYVLAVGGGAMAIGLLQSMDNLLSALYSLPGGYIADRLGARRTLLLFDLVAMVGFVVVIVFPVWQAVLVGAVFFISWSAVSLPATIGLIHSVLPPHRRTMAVTMHSLVRRVPMAVGPLIGGALVVALGERDGVRAAFLVALLSAGLGVALQERLLGGDPRARAQIARPACTPPPSPVALYRLMSPALRRLLASDIMIRFCEQIPYAFVVVWCMKTIAEPVTALQFGLLTSIEMATSVLVYVPVAWLADRGSKKPFIVTTFVFFTLFPIALLNSRSMTWLVPAFVLRGLKELGEPTRKSLIMELAPNDCQAAAFGLYYLIRDFVVTFAALGGAILWQVSPEANLLTAFAFGAIGTAGFWVFGRSR